MSEAMAVAEVVEAMNVQWCKYLADMRKQSPVEGAAELLLHQVFTDGWSRGYAFGVKWDGRQG